MLESRSSFDSEQLSLPEKSVVENLVMTPSDLILPLLSLKIEGARRQKTSTQKITMRIFWIALGIIALGSSTLQAQRVTVTLRGMEIGPGEFISKIDSISTNPNNKAAANEVPSNLINAINDGWRKTYYCASAKNNPKITVDNTIPFSPIKFAAASEAQRNADAYNIKTVSIEQMSWFRAEGRRTLKLRLKDGRQQNALQQITELTPTYARMELLRANKGLDLAWDCREPLTMIPSDQLQAILERQFDLTNPSEWLRMYDFYLNAERFNEAIKTLEEAIKRFPSELGPRKNLISQARQLYATKQFEEINIRREAGQWKLAAELLGSFDKSLLETQINAKNQLEQIRSDLELIQRVIVTLKERVAKLPQADQQAIEPILSEIFNEITVESAIRMDDYLRLSANEAAPNENMVALAVGGWILGPGSGMQNFATAKSLVLTRKLVKDYLTESSPAKRDLILNQIKTEEGGQPQLVAKILNTMKPPLALSQPQENDPIGFHRQHVTLPSGDVVEYTVQLPPEYDANRKYPCILALPGSRSHFKSNLIIDFWCGSPVELPELGKQRFGQASRYGYIVICPNWITEKQSSYQYTEMEKSRILSCFRDAMRRTSINSDKAFVTGHFDGAIAAWDIVGSHPDMWAGAMMFSPPRADKFIVHYHSNLLANKANPEQVPPATYFVIGELDSSLDEVQGGPANGMTSTLDKMLKGADYDTLLVTPIGQSRGLFAAELPRIMQWMQLPNHVRLKNPRNIDCVSLRAGDKLFYWLESPQISPENVTNAFEFVPSRDAASKGNFEASLMEPSQNGIRISKIPSADRTALVWLTPEMIDFGRDVTFLFRDKKIKESRSPRVEVMLEDVRTRADRAHFFWDVVQVSATK
ncbi:MAG: hypothetical protein U0930_07910 [Pirellulales bacterium]